MKLMPFVAAWIALGLVSCETAGPTATGPSRGLESIQAPLERIPVRQEVIRGLVPDNKPVIEQVEATKNDVQAAQSGVDQTQEEINGLKTALEDQKVKTKEAQSAADQAFRSKLNWIKLSCITLLGVSIGLSIFVSKRFIVLGLASVSMLFAVIIFDFIAKIAVPVFCIVISLISIYLAYEIFFKHKKINDLLKS